MSTIQNKVRALSRGGEIVEIVVTHILNLAGSITSLIQTKFKFYQKRGMSLTKYCWYFLGVKIEATREETSFFFNLSDKHPCYLTIALPTHHPPPPSIRLRPKGSVMILFSCTNNRMWLSQSLDNWRSALTYIPKSSTNNSIWDSDGSEVIPVPGVTS